MSKRYLKITIAILFAITVTLTITSMARYYTYRERMVWAEDVKINYDFKNKELDSKIREINSNLEQLQEKYYEEKVTKLLGRDKLIEIAKEQWQYSVMVNDEPLKNDFTYPKSKDVTVTLIETKPFPKVLPKSIMNLGSIVSGDKLDKFYDHIIIDTTVPYTKDVKNYGDAIKVYYVFKKIPSGTIINLKLSGILMERLKFENDMPEIIIK